GELAVGDFNQDGALDLVMTDTSGVRVIYGKAPTLVPNTTAATARNLGTVVHLLNPAGALVPGFEDAYYQLTVPTEVPAGAGPEVLDFSALFQDVQGTGLQMEVLDSTGTIVLGSGSRFRLSRLQKVL